MRIRKARKAKVRKAPAISEQRATHNQRKLAPRRATSLRAVAGADESVRRDSDDELEYSRKIAEARALLQSNCVHGVIASPSHPYSEPSPSITDADTWSSSDYYCPVMALPPSSVSASNRGLEYAIGIGIAMTEHERWLLETLLSDHTKSKSLEHGSLGDFACCPEIEVERHQERAEVKESSCSFIGYAINFHTEGLDEEEQEPQGKL